MDLRSESLEITFKWLAQDKRREILRRLMDQFMQTMHDEFRMRFDATVYAKKCARALAALMDSECTVHIHLIWVCENAFMKQTRNGRIEWKKYAHTHMNEKKIRFQRDTTDKPNIARAHTHTHIIVIIEYFVWRYSH